MKVFSLPVKNFSSSKEEDSSDFLKVTLTAIAEGKNLNKSIFTYEGMEKHKDTFINKPILCAFPNGQMGENHNFEIAVDPETNEEYQTFLGKNSERPVGLIPESSNIRIENINGKNWIVLDGYIWKKYNYELVQDILKKSNGWSIRNNKNISVEIIVDDKTMEFSEDGYEILNDWTGNGITILADHVTPAIEGANISLNTKAKAFSKADYDEYIKGFMKDFSMFSKKEKYGTGKSLKVDKSKESASNEEWGNVDKTKLRNDVLEAKNYKSIVKDVYMKVENGWEESPSECLKYPVMQIKGEKLVYNLNALSSALGYAKKENETEVIKKVESIRKKMGIEDDKNFEERRSVMNFSELFENNDEYIFIEAMNENKVLVFSKSEKVFKAIPYEESEDSNVILMTEKANECSLFVSEKEKIVEQDKAEEDMSEKEEIVEQDKEEEGFSCEKELSEIFTKMMADKTEKEEIVEQDKEEEHDDEEEHEEEHKEDYADLEKECACLKEEKETMSKQIETLSSELESCKNECEEKDKMLSECKEKLESYEEREKEQMYSEMLSELKEFAKANHMSEEDFVEAQEKTKEFSSKDEFMKFVVFSQYTKNKANKSNDFVNMGGANFQQYNVPSTENCWEKLAKI